MVETEVLDLYWSEALLCRIWTNLTTSWFEFSGSAPVLEINIILPIRCLVLSFLSSFVLRLNLEGRMAIVGFQTICRRLFAAFVSTKLVSALRIELMSNTTKVSRVNIRINDTASGSFNVQKWKLCAVGENIDSGVSREDLFSHAKLSCQTFAKYQEFGALTSTKCHKSCSENLPLESVTLHLCPTHGQNKRPHWHFWNPFPIRLDLLSPTTSAPGCHSLKIMVAGALQWNQTGVCPYQHKRTAGVTSCHSVSRTLQSDTNGTHLVKTHSLLWISFNT